MLQFCRVKVENAYTADTTGYLTVDSGRSDVAGPTPDLALVLLIVPYITRSSTEPRWRERTWPTPRRRNTTCCSRILATGEVFWDTTLDDGVTRKLGLLLLLACSCGCLPQKLRSQ